MHLRRRGYQWVAGAIIARFTTAMIASCSSSTGPVALEGVIASATQSKVAITNRRTRPVYVFVVGRNAAALIDWLPCVTGPGCQSVAVGSTKEFEINPLLSSYHETEALVYWWHSTTRDGTLQADSVRAMVVPMK